VATKSVERKREHSWEIADREIWSLIKVMLRESASVGGHLGGPKRHRRRKPGSWPVLQLERILNLAVARRKPYAYTKILDRWLTKHGIRVPEGVFARDLHSRGSGRRPSKKMQRDRLLVQANHWLRRIVRPLIRF
jgi:hypothetical protein